MIFDFLGFEVNDVVIGLWMEFEIWCFWMCRGFIKIGFS